MSWLIIFKAKLRAFWKHATVTFKIGKKSFHELAVGVTNFDELFEGLEHGTRTKYIPILLSIRRRFALSEYF